MEKRQYKPPQARDLSGFGVSGQGPLGECVAGPYPWYSCSEGPGFSSGPCTDGNMPEDSSTCLDGGFHTTPACDFGSSAATLCISGANQQ